MSIATNVRFDQSSYSNQYTSLVQCALCGESVPASQATAYDTQRTLGDGLFEDTGVCFVCQPCEEDYAQYGDGFRE